ncbi:MAG: alpha/beta hydrolase family protein [Terracidiphilus sp.]
MKTILKILLLWRLPRPSLSRFAAGMIAVGLTAALPASAGVTPQRVDAWRRQMRRTLYIPTPLPALKAKSYGNFSPTPGVIAERVSYATEYGLRIPAIVYRPAHVTGRIPGLVVVNGHGADKTSWYDYYTGILYAKAGAVVVTYDAIGEGERNDQHQDGADECERLIQVPGVPQRMGGLMITDAMQGVAYLRSLSIVDPGRIGVLGFSLGSFVASLTGAIDPNFHALFLTGGGDLDGPGGYWDSSQCVMTQSAPYKAMRFLGDRGAAIFTLNARRGPTFILNGADDTVVAIPTHGAAFFHDLRQRTIALNGSPENVFTTWFDPGASHRPAWVLKVAAEWLEKQLQFPNWNPAKLKTMPVIRIGTWAKENGVYLNRGERREDRDAGLEAIDAGVPKLTPQQLDVLPMSEWEEERGQFIWAVWAKDAVAAAVRQSVGVSDDMPMKGKR